MNALNDWSSFLDGSVMVAGKPGKTNGGSSGLTQENFFLRIVNCGIQTQRSLSTSSISRIRLAFD